MYVASSYLMRAIISSIWYAGWIYCPAMHREAEKLYMLIVLTLNGIMAPIMRNARNMPVNLVTTDAASKFQL